MPSSKALVQSGSHCHFDKMERSIQLISHSCSRSVTGPLPGAPHAAMTEELASRRDVCVPPFLTEHRVPSRRAAGRSRATAHLYARGAGCVPRQGARAPAWASSQAIRAWITNLWSISHTATGTNDRDRTYDITRVHRHRAGSRASR